MRRAITLATVAAAGLAMALSAVAAPTTAAQTLTADRPTMPAAKGPTSWTKVSTGTVSSSSEPALYRTGDGVLHVAYAKGGGGDALRWTNISKRGTRLGQGTILSGWDSYSSNPKLIPAPNNRLRLVFGGIDGDGSAPYNDNRLFTTTAGSGGQSWSLAPGALTYESVGTYGIGALPVTGQAPLTAVAFNGEIYWRQADGSTTPTTPGNQVSNGGCCAYHSALARDARTGAVVLGWYSGGGAQHSGVFVKRLRPTAGPKVKAPGSSKLDTDQTVALTGRRDAPGTYAAYCTGYPSCTSVKLWRVGAQRAITVPGSRNAESIALAPAPFGRLWVVWVNDLTNRVHATLTNKKATRFGAVRTVKTPRLDTYRLSAHAGAVRHVDLVVNSNGALFHRRLLPGLRVTAKPRRFDNDRRHVVTFTVADAGAPVAGARVRVAGKTKITGAKGKAFVTFRRGARPGRYLATATKSGYAAGHVSLRILR
jgi:hypothetical protein